MSYDLENAVKRGDELFDNSEQLKAECRRLGNIIDHMQSAYDDKCEQLRERDEKLAAIYNLLRAHNLDSEDLTKYGYVDDSEEEE